MELAVRWVITWTLPADYGVSKLFFPLQRPPDRCLADCLDSLSNIFYAVNCIKMGS